MNRLRREYGVLMACPRDMRVLLAANTILAFALPVIDIFVAAYVMRNSHDPGMVVTFQLAIYTGIPLAFFVNGYLLGRLSVRNLYTAGMLLLGVSLAAMMAPGALTVVGILAFGLFMGLSYGLFAANRNLLALSTTHDGNRNYYYGVEMFVYAATSVVVPFAVGWLIEMAASHSWLDGSRNNGYRVVAGCVCALTLLAAAVCQQGKFPEPRVAPFMYLQVHPVWRKMLWLAVLKGLAQGYLVTAPAILILSLVGQEAALGTVQAVGGILSAILLYGAGRRAQPRHRIFVFGVGLVLFALGGVVNALLFNAAGVLVLVACLLVAKPLLDLAYFPIQFLATEVVSSVEGRSHFSYLFSHECGICVGRLLGCLLFIVLAYCVSQTAALKYALPIVGGVQLLSLGVARKVISGVSRLKASLRASQARNSKSGIAVASAPAI
jgi:YQGE family putative transporter